MPSYPNYDPQPVRDSLREFGERQECEGRLPEVVVNPNFTGKFRLPRGLMKPKVFFCLAWISWDLSPEVGLMIREWIRESHSDRFPIEWSSKITLAISNKAMAEMVFKELLKGTTRAFFGNWFPLTKLALRSLRSLSESRRVKRAARKRGYNDHGSAKPRHKWLPSSSFELNQLHEEIEKERKVKKDSSALIFGFLS